MSNAKVLSVEALEEYYLYLRQFRTGMLKEMESLDLELRRLSYWVEVEAQRYWESENQLIRRKLSEYLLQLSRCMSYVRESERKPCTEEKKQVAKAKERAGLCESKIQIQKAAATHWESRKTKVRTKLQRSRDMAESELSVALNRLQKYLEQLEAYRQVASGALRPESSSGGSETSGDLDDKKTVEAVSENLDRQTDEKSTENRP